MVLLFCPGEMVHLSHRQGNLHTRIAKFHVSVESIIPIVDAQMIYFGNNM
jgi:hypothetical protein